MQQNSITFYLRYQTYAHNSTIWQTKRLNTGCLKPQTGQIINGENAIM